MGICTKKDCLKVCSDAKKYYLYEFSNRLETCIDCKNSLVDDKIKQKTEQEIRLNYVKRFWEKQSKYKN